MSDQMIFAEEEILEKSEHDTETNWKILIVDDDEAIHSTTRLVLSDFSYDDKKLDFFACYSSKEAMEFVQEHDDIAIILLDVVMETKHAGLKFIQWFREEHGNLLTRILLRTGQPGEAPEKNVILDYDINDYLHKLELTAQRLTTSLCSALRSYRQLYTIEENRKGLAYIIDASTDLFKNQSLQQMVQGMVTQVVPLLGASDSVYVSINSISTTVNIADTLEFQLLGATGKYSERWSRKEKLTMDNDPEIVQMLNKALLMKKSIFENCNAVIYCPVNKDRILLLFINDCPSGIKPDEDLIMLLSKNIGIAFNNLSLQQEIQETQKEFLWRLGDVVELRSKETHKHIERVAYYADRLSKKLGLSEEKQNFLYIASAMHDVGKIAIPDQILLKPDLYTEEEREIMKNHTLEGYNLLAASKRPLVALAARIAYEHHECWDGSGYPQGLKGEEISIEGRIVSIVDVYDALVSKRIYKDVWTLKDARQFIMDERGKMFDPAVVDAFLEILDEDNQFL